MTATNSSRRYYIAPNDAEHFTTTLLTKAGLPSTDAAQMAHSLVLADLRGVDTHGLSRLQQYLSRLSSGLVNGTPQIVATSKTPVAAHISGDNGFGFIVAARGMKEAIDRAAIYGIGIVTASHSNHFGMAATYVLQALERGMMSLVFTNASPQMAPHGGRDALLGTSPLAAGAPAGNEVPFVLDMSPCVVAKGKVRRAARRGERIPLGWALDGDGEPTTDADQAMKGLMAPIAGPKGSGLAVLMDVFGGVLSGAAFAGEVGNQYEEARPQNVGHCFVAIKPDVFMSAEVFRERMDVLVQRVHGVTPAKNAEEVLFPGEPESRATERHRTEGLPFAEAEMEMFRSMAREFDVPELSASDTPLTA